MKKLFILIAAAFLTTGAFAQNIEYGIKGGFNMASLTDVDDAKFKPSFYLGGFVEFGINDFLSIQPELVYSRQGVYHKHSGTKSWSRMNYLNLPVMFKLYVLEDLSLDLGPQFGYMLNAKSKVKFGGATVKSDINDTKDFDVSFGMGLSYKICSNFDISARYNLGLTETFDHTGGDKVKNSVIQFGVGYRF